MNDTTTSASGASLTGDAIGLLTSAHLVVIAILALLVIAGIVWGARLKRRRKTAEHEVRDHNATIDTPDAPVDPAPAAPETAAEPVAGTPAREPLADEPIAAATPLVENPAAVAAPAAPAAAPTPAPASDADGPVTQLKGLGPKVATRLGELGITTVGQIAALTDDKAQALDTQLGAFAGRIARDRWIEQARFLAAGDKAGFEAVFGKL